MEKEILHYLKVLRKLKKARTTLRVGLKILFLLAFYGIFVNSILVITLSATATFFVILGIERRLAYKMGVGGFKHLYAQLSKSQNLQFNFYGHQINIDCNYPASYIIKLTSPEGETQKFSSNRNEPLDLLEAISSSLTAIKTYRLFSTYDL